MSAVSGWIDRLGSRDRRALGLGAILLVPAALWMFGVQPYRAHLAVARERLVIERDLLQREQELVLRAPELPSAIEHARDKLLRGETRLVRARSALLAEAELTNQLERAATASRVLLEDIQSVELPRGEAPPPGLEVIRLRVVGESDLQGVLTYLDAIEGHEYFLRVRGLALEPQMVRQGGNGNNQPARPNGVVEFQLVVDGFARLSEADHPTEGEEGR